MNHTILFLLPSLFYYTPDKEIKYCWNNKYKNRFNQTLFDEPTDKKSRILNRRVWKSKFDEKISKTNFSSKNSDELNKDNNKIVECDEYLNVHSFNLYMDTISTLFQEAKDLTELTGNLIKWAIRIEDSKIKLEVFKKGILINTRIENYHYPFKRLGKFFNNHRLIASSLFNNDDIVILTSFGILIYSFRENNKSIFLNYFYFMKLYYICVDDNKKYMKRLQHYKEIFSKSTLPLPNHDSFRLDGWVSDVTSNKSSLLKYGVELLKFAIKEHKLELIDNIYKKCMTYFKEDLMNNKSFLSIITSAMPLLNEYYPEYILKYSSETNMIIDSSFYSIEHQNKNLHLYSFFQSLQIANLSKSFLWTKYHCKLYELFLGKDRIKKSKTLFYILCVIQALIILLTLPLYLTTFYILSKYNFINNICIMDVFSFAYFYTESKIFKLLKNI
jgi:hypothetical protein